MNRKLTVSLLVVAILSVIFIGFAKHQADRPVQSKLSDNMAVYANVPPSRFLDNIRSFQPTNTEAPYFTNLSEQQLMERSKFNAEHLTANAINDEYLKFQVARVNLANQQIRIGTSDYKYEEFSDQDRATSYTLSGAGDDVISPANLTLLIRQAQSEIKDRNQTIWSATRWGLALFIIMSVIGLLLLFNIESISEVLISLVIKDARPGPAVKLSVVVSAFILIATSLYILFQAYQTIS